jgi:hypothetical protein
MSHYNDGSFQTFGANDMPNWCQNTVTFTHQDATQLNRLVEAGNSGKLFNEFVPVPKSLCKNIIRLGDKRRFRRFNRIETRNVKKFGYSNSYYFCKANWGTKWDADCFTLYDGGVGHVKVGFNTANTPPIEFYNQMVELGFGVDAFYYEGGNCYCGEYCDGSYTDYEWDDLESAKANIPDYIDEEFAITENMEE